MLSEREYVWILPDSDRWTLDDAARELMILCEELGIAAEFGIAPLAGAIRVDGFEGTYRQLRELVDWIDGEIEYGEPDSH